MRSWLCALCRAEVICERARVRKGACVSACKNERFRLVPPAELLLSFSHRVTAHADSDPPGQHRPHPEAARWCHCAVDGVVPTCGEAWESCASMGAGGCCGTRGRGRSCGARALPLTREILRLGEMLETGQGVVDKDAGHG